MLSKCFLYCDFDMLLYLSVYSTKMHTKLHLGTYQFYETTKETICCFDFMEAGSLYPITEQPTFTEHSEFCENTDCTIRSPTAKNIPKTAHEQIGRASCRERV